MCAIDTVVLGFGRLGGAFKHKGIYTAATTSL